MKWEDLEPGDTVRIIDKVGNNYKLEGTLKTFVNNFCFQDLTVKNIYINGEKLSLCLINLYKKELNFTIDKDGVSHYWHNFIDGVIPIEVIRLKED